MSPVSVQYKFRRDRVAFGGTASLMEEPGRFYRDRITFGGTGSLLDKLGRFQGDENIYEVTLLDLVPPKLILLFIYLFWNLWNSELYLSTKPPNCTKTIKINDIT